MKRENNIKMTKGGMNTDSIQWHDLTSPEPFKELHIPLPEKLESDADFAQLFQWLISDFHDGINIYGKNFGYVERQRMLSGLLQAIKFGMPQANPDYITNYPASLEDIKLLFAHLMLMSMDLAKKRMGENNEGDIEGM